YCFRVCGRETLRGFFDKLELVLLNCLPKMPHCASRLCCLLTPDDSMLTARNVANFIYYSEHEAFDMFFPQS
ncbi:MAG: hypothetical protein Q4C32_09270, partial [Eubacteriales bacterium]|nr:hypothetical protein [Eubacteriales bacterium]